MKQAVGNGGTARFLMICIGSSKGRNFSTMVIMVQISEGVNVVCIHHLWTLCENSILILNW